MINLPLAYYLLMSAGILCEQSNFLTLAFQGEQFWKSAGLTCVCFTCHSERGLWSSSWIKTFKIWGFELQIWFYLFFFLIPTLGCFLSHLGSHSWWGSCPFLLILFLKMHLRASIHVSLTCFISSLISPLFPTTIPISKCSKCWFLCSRLTLSF